MTHAGDVGVTLGFRQLRVLQLAVDFPPVGGSLPDGHAIRLGDDGQDGNHLAQLCHKPASQDNVFIPEYYFYCNDCIRRVLFDVPAGCMSVWVYPTELPPSISQIGGVMNNSKYNCIRRQLCSTPLFELHACMPPPVQHFQVCCNCITWHWAGCLHTPCCTPHLADSSVSHAQSCKCAEMAVQDSMHKVLVSRRKQPGKMTRLRSTGRSL